MSAHKRLLLTVAGRWDSMSPDMRARARELAGDDRFPLIPGYEAGYLFGHTRWRREGFFEYDVDSRPISAVLSSF
jgi:hypothetical protein